MHDVGVVELARLEPQRLEFRLGEFGRLLAVRAELAHQALRHDRADGGGDQERFDAHVHQTRDRAGRVVRVQRAENEVAREAALIAIDAVSKSRISPIMMMFGAWRSIERNAAGNVMPMSALTCT